MYAGRLNEPGRLEEVAHAGRIAVNRVGELPRPIDFLLSGMTSRIIDGRGRRRPGISRWSCGTTTQTTRVPRSMAVPHRAGVRGP